MIIRPSGPRTSPIPMGPTPASPYGDPNRRPLRQYPIPMGGRRVLGTMKKGGKIKKTGLYKLHKGERVVPLSSLRRAR